MPLVSFADGEIFGITLDNTCKTMIKNNITTDCPTYELLDSMYNDLGCEYKGLLCLEWFKQTNVNDGYILDPSFGIQKQIKMINIRANFEEYHLQGDEGYSNEDRTIHYGLSRFVDSCRTAYIDAGQWFGLLGDTIMYLDSKCTKTNYIEGRSHNLSRTVHDISESYKWQLDEWIKESLERCRVKCFEY